MTAPAEIDAIAPEIKANGTALPATTLEMLTGLRVSKGLRIAARAELHFADVGFTVAAGGAFSIGTAIDIGLAGASDGVLFSGEVTGVEMQLDRGVPDFTVVADDLSYKLTLGTKADTFVQTTYSDIVSKMAAASGLTADVDATDIRFDYVLQTDSDYGFLCEIADRTGFDWWVDQRTLSFKKPTVTGAPVRLTFGENLSQFSVRASALHPGNVTVNGWGAKQKSAVAGSAKMSSVQGGPTAALLTPFIKASSLAATARTQISTDTPLSQNEANALADRAVAGHATGAVTARGTCLINGAIRPRVQVAIEGAGPASGTYTITEVEHSYTQRGFETRFLAGERRPRDLVDLLSSSRTSSFRRDGLVVGVITQVGNSQGAPGDVKVSYPGVDDQLTSGWARMLSVGGGNKRGMTFVPEVNDEVLVAFEGGDPRRPVVLGGLFNGKDSQPPFRFASGTVATRQITSRLGHTFEFGDGTAPEDQYIGLALAGGHSLIKLGKQALEATVPAGTPITLKAGSASIQIDDQGQITLSGKKITLKAETDVEISGLNVTAKANVKLAGSAAMVELKANAQAEVSAAGPVMIKGNPVMVN